MVHIKSADKIILSASNERLLLLRLVDALNDDDVAPENNPLTVVNDEEYAKLLIHSGKYVPSI